MKILFILKLVASIALVFFGFFAYLKNKKSPVNAALLKLTLCISLWIVSYSYANVKFDPFSDPLFRLGFVGIIFIPITFYEFISNFLARKERLFVQFNYLVGFVLTILLYFFDQLISGFNTFPWGVYPKAVLPAHPIFLAYFFSLFTLAFIWLVLGIIHQRKEKNLIQLAKINYVFWGLIIASFGSIDFLPNYGIDIYPFGFFLMVPFPVIFTYAVVKYRLMDINVVITRTGIFVAVYSMVLGIPFAIAFGLHEKLEGVLGPSWWLIPLAVSTLLATVGPFLYFYIQQKTEDRLLQEQKRYQLTLRQASSGMGRIKDLKQLLNLIVHIVTRAVHLEHSAVYIYNSMNKSYVLGAYRRKKEGLRIVSSLDKNSPLISYLNNTRAPAVYDEIKQKTQDYGDRQLAQLELSLKELEASVVVPSFIEDRLLGILVLGQKKSGKLYSESDLSVFTIVANQAALAIENAQFYEDMKRTQEQLFKAEKMATIGTMADGLSHQINNRLHALGFIAGDALDSIKQKREKGNGSIPEDIKQLMTDVEYALTRIQDNVKQGGEIVQGLLKYTRKGDQGMTAVDFDQLLKSSFEMAQYKVKLNALTILKEFPIDLPKIKGNFTQLQEVFFNLVDNANDAMMQRKTEKKEPDYKPTLRITASAAADWINISVRDNGIGVRKEDAEKLFTPFFTTKLSSRRGTGLGLYVIQKLIEENHDGKVIFQSEYMKGTSFLIELPMWKG